MKKRLIILSDLWGKEKSEWLDNYIQNLKNAFEIEYYDCCELGDVDKSIYTEEILHQQFVNGGVNKAVQKLIDLEKGKINILAFSIGGVIGWKFGIESNKIESLYCVSSTRLRHESNKPKGIIHLYFGELDDFKPQKDWFNKMDLNYDILNDKNGEIEYANGNKYLGEVVNDKRQGLGKIITPEGGIQNDGNWFENEWIDANKNNPNAVPINYSQNRIIVEVDFNGTKFPMLLDTGASSTVINSEIFSALVTLKQIKIKKYI